MVNGDKRKRAVKRLTDKADAKKTSAKKPVKSKAKPAQKKSVVKKSAPRKSAKRKKSSKRLSWKWLFFGFVLLIALVSIWGTIKPLPAGIARKYEPSRTDDVNLLIDQTYKKDGTMHYDHEIFREIFNAIDAADDFIIMDMFLFNNAYDGPEQFPALSQQLTQHLIQKKKQNPDVRIYVLTDPINSFYGSYTPKHIEQLRANGIYVYETDLKKLRDSNPLYSGLWRSTIRWFGNNGNGQLTNIFSKNEPDVTVRGYASLLNFKANHRKTLVTEKQAIVASSNPHDPSAHHQNVALKMSGRIQEDLLHSEIAAINMSGGKLERSDFTIRHRAFNNLMDYETTLVTEGRIKEQLIEAIDAANDNDQIRIGMFYLSERGVIHALLDAAKHGADIRLILDVNKEAFGKEKPGIPNKPVANELVRKSDDRIQVKWAVSHGEQFHSKYILISNDQENSSTLFLGSANLTRRNIGNFNMETDVKVSGNSNLPVFTQLAADFDAKWDNTYAHVTDNYDVKKDPSFFKTVLYRIQEFTGLSSF